jgi:hypothetical protein
VIHFVFIDRMSHNVLQYTTFQPAYKVMRSIAAGWNVGEGGVGTK